MLFSTCIFAAPIHERDSSAPFIMLRMMSEASEDCEYMKFITNILKKYPDTIDEVWLATHPYFSALETIQTDAKEHLTKISKLWSDIGIETSYQIGTTLGHGNNCKNEYGFSKDAFKVDYKGKHTKKLCANAPEVRDYFYKRTKILIENAPLKRIWLDDDFRMGMCLEHLCFCKFCLEKFNTKENTNFDSKSLYAKLISKDTANIKIRKAYMDFQTESLAELSEIVAKANADSSKKVVLGIQAMCPIADLCHDYPKLITKLAGNKKAGIRIGTGCYDEFTGDGIKRKILGVMYGAERCSRSKNVYQICYELENYPHIETLKTPRAIMIESALALAAGCDSLALYWDNVVFSQKANVYEKFYKTVKEYRPFLEKVGKFYKGTKPWGIGRFIGDTMYAYPNKRGTRFEIASLPSQEEIDLFNSGYPIRCTDSYPDIILLNKDIISRVNDLELKKLLSKNCIADSNTLIALEKRGIKLPVKVVKTDKGEVFGGSYAEIHKGERFNMIPWREFSYLELTDSNVKNVSAVKNFLDKEVKSAFAVFDTKFGGKIFAVAGNGIYRYSTESRRLAFLDAIDMLALAPVRLETNHQMLFIPRVNKNGEFANALFYNFTQGECDEIVLKIRSKSAKKYKLIRPLLNDVIIESKKSPNSDEYILKLPELAPVSVYAIKKID